MKNIFPPLLFFLFSASAVSVSSAAEPDTLLVTDISRDTAGETPREWLNVLPQKHRVYTNYTVEYLETGPYIKAASNSAGSWLERDMNDMDISRYPVVEWEWMVSVFPDVEWERNKSEDDFAIRIELVFDYRGSAANPLNLLRKGLITTLFRHNPPVIVLSYVWSVGVPVDIGYQSPEKGNVMVIPVESGSFAIRRWFHETRDIRTDIKRFLPGEKKIALKKIRIRSDADNSGTKAESGIRNIRFLRRSPETGGLE